MFNVGLVRTERGREFNWEEAVKAEQNRTEQNRSLFSENHNSDIEKEKKKKGDTHKTHT